MKKYLLFNVLILILLITACNKTPEVKPCNESFEETFIDERDGQTYKVVKIGDQVWMAENLNYSVTGRCYDHLDSLCNIYGRLYTWHEILNNEEYIYNESEIKGICPNNFHIPSIYEWRTLINNVGGNENAQFKLLNTTLWDRTEELTDEFGFNILPSGKEGGHYVMNDAGTWEYVEFQGLGYLSNIISSTFAGDTSLIWYMRIYNSKPRITERKSRHTFPDNSKEALFCVRCIKNCD